MVIPPDWYFKEFGSDDEVDEFGVPLAIRWTVTLDDGSTVVLPAAPDEFTVEKFGYGPAEFLRYVSCYDAATDTWVPGTTVTHEDRELICRLGNVYLVLGTFDWDDIGCFIREDARPSGLWVVGGFADELDGLVASIAMSRLAFRGALVRFEWFEIDSESWRPDAASRIAWLPRTGGCVLVRRDHRYLVAMRRWSDDQPTMTLVEKHADEERAIEKLVQLADDANIDLIDGLPARALLTLRRRGPAGPGTGRVQRNVADSAVRHDDTDVYPDDDEESDEAADEEDLGPLDEFGIPYSCWETYWDDDGLEVELPPLSLDPDIADRLGRDAYVDIDELLHYFHIIFESHYVHDGPGPVTWEKHDYLCCLRGLYVIIHAGDSGLDYTVLGHVDEVEALRECSDHLPWLAFTGERLVATYDAYEDDGFIPERLLTLAPSPSSRRGEARRQAIDGFDRLRISVDGTVLAGLGAVAELPGERFVVIPVDRADANELLGSVRDASRGRIQAGRQRRSAIVTDSILPTTAVRIAAAFGETHLYVIDGDTVAMVDTALPAIVATRPRIGDSDNAASSGRSER